MGNVTHGARGNRESRTVRVTQRSLFSCKPLTRTSRRISVAIPLRTRNSFASRAGEISRLDRFSRNQNPLDNSRFQDDPESAIAFDIGKPLKVSPRSIPGKEIQRPNREMRMICLAGARGNRTHPGHVPRPALDLKSRRATRRLCAPKECSNFATQTAAVKPSLDSTLSQCEHGGNVLTA